MDYFFEFIIRLLLSIEISHVHTFLTIDKVNVFDFLFEEF